MRRCLRAFLVGLITLSLLGGPAHACWRSRQARHCRTVVVTTYSAPSWPVSGDPCGQTVVVVPSPCVPTVACCGEGVVMAEGGTTSVETVVDGHVAGSVVESAPRSQPTPAAEQPRPEAVAESKAVELEQVPAQPAAEAGGVQKTSSEQPLAEPAAPAGTRPESQSVLAAEPEMKEPASEPAEPAPAEPVQPAPVEPKEPQPAIEDPAAIEGDEPEMKEEEAPAEPGAAEPADEPTAEPAAPASENPVEPPMEEDAGEPVGDPEPAPAEPGTAPEPETKTEGKPEPEPEPAPEEENIFEELDDEAGDAAPADEDEEMADEPAAPAEPAEPAADPFGEGDADAGEPEMTEDEPAAAEGDSEAADPFADDDAAPAEKPAADGDSSGDAEPSAPSEPAEPAAESEAPAADPFARGEPERRWIDATGTASMVATLIEVGADGRCVLEMRGRRIAVPVENLSGHDRDYVRQAGVRLAKLRGDKAGETAAAAPAPTDTAGL